MPSFHSGKDSPKQKQTNINIFALMMARLCIIKLEFDCTVSGINDSIAFTSPIIKERDTTDSVTFGRKSSCNH